MLTFVSAQTTQPVKYNIKVSGTIKNLPTPAPDFLLLTNNGYNLRVLGKIPVTTTDSINSSFLVNINEVTPGVYYLAFDRERIKEIIVNGKEEISMTADYNAYNSGTVNSAVNTAYKDSKAKMDAVYAQLGPLYQQYQLAVRQKKDLTSINATIKTKEAEKLAIWNSVKDQYPLVGSILSLWTFQTYASQPVGYTNESEYVAKEYFSNIDLNANTFTFIHELKESFRNYTNVLANSAAPINVQEYYLDTNLNKLGTANLSHKTALAGVIAGYARSKNANSYTKYASQYLKLYGDDPNVNKELQANIEKLKAFMTGIEAPDITEKTPEGGTMSLSDLRGKVVLLDFWASWCGPCRKKNPELVQLYNKYKDRGFEIFAVSLDKNENRWKAAIAQDKLTWSHVSDLGGWGSKPARKYGVSSIPSAVLIDKEGKIIARDVKGPYLEKMIEEALNK